jgi:hypothetical protein
MSFSTPASKAIEELFGRDVVVVLLPASRRVNAGVKLHRFPEQRCINDVDENALEDGLVSWVSGWVQIVFGESALLRRESRLL